MENTTTEEKYKKLAYLFEKYKGHRFKLFEPVLFYCKERSSPTKFTIKPHIHWYYDNDADRYIFYDPLIMYCGSYVIPLDGNEELVGFNGETEILSEYVKEIRNN